ncbi:hypothetical protein VOLCADRAFT_107515 [Volvox carteri f. nagariensis]|uniref:Uncharacterized protein n=1 Tax=Volvox carteri f. nagariensis TaxID=3068 RepID=D8UEI8_VOLCA|nr:uncharacterized protein VOLCADRAFT_107515 [Volvox carteri f. nagariensis]EFJ41890.1 hypothetical protein VOLCADRAFT_107515 [Volvox carteri f. nagariensis]|eukprot:XP_002957088.1 hypothetical protein VOLCADRAFT_107515 [Volvox carteri f. nagariensis]
MAAPHKSHENTTIIPGVSMNMSVKIGRNAAELAKPCFTAGTSRVSRSRALGLRNRRKAVNPKSPPSPNQESAVNTRTGKVAFGPWMGPYETHVDTAAAGPPIFLDPNGNTHASLHAPESQPPPVDPKGAEPLPQQEQEQAPESQPQQTTPETKPQPARFVKAAAVPTTRELYAIVAKVTQRNAMMAAAQARPLSQWLGGARGKPHGSGRCGNIMARSINQPRRS